MKTFKSNMCFLKSFVCFFFTIRLLGLKKYCVFYVAVIDMLILPITFSHAQIKDLEASTKNY